MTGYTVLAGFLIFFLLFIYGKLNYERNKKTRTSNNTQDRNISLDLGIAICFKFLLIYGGLVSVPRFA